MTKKAIITPQEAVNLALAVLLDVHPREVFRPALCSASASIILLHNHPSGDIEPSADDLAVTKRLEQAGAILGIDLVDHIIFTSDGKFFSMKEEKIIK